MRVLNHPLAIIGLSALMLLAPVARAGDITGAGATFPYPIFVKWAEIYKLQSGTGMNYQPIGSGNGIQQIQSNTVDFGASDAPLSSSELSQKGLTQFPVLIGGVVPAFNIPGIASGQLKLDSEVLADIYLGKIKKWNDRRIAADNAGLVLPDESIKVLYRSDASGTSYIFTSFLGQVSPDWSSNVGKGMTVRWPVGTGGKGNEGVASYINRIKYSIGYVEYAFAMQNNLSFSSVRNRDGYFVKPDAASFKAAASVAKWGRENGFNETLTNAPGKESWPITGISFVLMQKVSTKPENSLETLKFFDWAYKHGNTTASALGYVTLPDNVLPLVVETWKSQIKSATGTPVWK